MLPADRAWLAIGVGVTAYELVACLRNWELLSEAADRYRSRHPLLVHGVIVYLACHLTRWCPERIDPLHQLAGRLAAKGKT